MGHQAPTSFSDDLPSGRVGEGPPLRRGASKSAAGKPPSVDVSAFGAREVFGQIYKLQKTEPLRLYLSDHPDLGRDTDSTHAFRSTHRGVVMLGGGKRSRKTYGVGGPKVAGVLSGTWQRYACPRTCRQHGVGSCGKHCCPTLERGSADWRKAGCVAPRDEFCDCHPPLTYDPVRLALIGVQKHEKFWSVVWPAISAWMPTPSGVKDWREDRSANRVVASDGSWIAQSVAYEAGVDAWESYNPAIILNDEMPPRAVFRNQMYRLIGRDAQLLICATPYKLIDNQETWCYHEVYARRAVMQERIQALSISTYDNLFLEPRARARVADMGRQLLAKGHKLEHDVSLLGKWTLRQDACVFSQRSIDAQSRYIKKPSKRFVTIPSALNIAPSDMKAERERYFAGPTRYPPGCNLSAYMRTQHMEARGGEGDATRGGVACYDCPEPCSLQERPPSVTTRADSLSMRPALSRETPPGVERVGVAQWDPCDPQMTYVIGFDTAKGKPGGDNIVADVLCVETGCQVAQYSGHCSPPTLASIVCALHDHYGRAFICGEENGYGLEVLMRLMHEYEVPGGSIFHRLDKTRRLPSGAPTATPGFWTSRGSKQARATLETPYGDYGAPLGLMRDALEERRIVLRSEHTWAELHSFVHEDGRYEALTGSHDDHIISMMLAVFAAEIKRQDADARMKSAQVDAFTRPVGEDPLNYDHNPWQAEEQHDHGAMAL